MTPGGVEVYFHASLTSVLERDGQPHGQPLYSRVTEPGTHWIGDWVGPKSILDAQMGNVLFFWWEFNLDSSAMQPVAVPTELWN